MRKAIFITGAASGIGRAAAVQFARRGWFVGLYDVQEAALAEVAELLGASSCCRGRLDVTDAAAYREAVAAFTTASGGRLDALFQSAGVLEMGLFDTIPLERAVRMVDINARGVVNGVYAALPWLEKTPGSVLATMGSASAVYGTPEFAVYSATKFFVRGLTEALDIELRAKGVRVVDVMPLYVATPMIHDAKVKARSMDALGVQLTADDVAARVVAAVESPPRASPHDIPQASVRLLRLLSGVVPASGRALQRFFAKL